MMKGFHVRVIRLDYYGWFLYDTFFSERINFVLKIWKDFKLIPWFIRKYFASIIEWIWASWLAFFPSGIIRKLQRELFKYYIYVSFQLCGFVEVFVAFLLPLDIKRLKFSWVTILSIYATSIDCQVHSLEVGWEPLRHLRWSC